MALLAVIKTYLKSDHFTGGGSLQRERTVIVPSTDSVEDIVAKLIEGTDVTKLREIAKGLNAHVKKRIDEFWEH